MRFTYKIITNMGLCFNPLGMIGFVVPESKWVDLDRPGTVIYGCRNLG
jgi:hypothetical protein